MSVRQAQGNAPVPPQNLEAEESVLGALMLGPRVIDRVVDLIAAGDFYRESHAKIYLACLSLNADGKPIDAITVVDHLEELGHLEEVGGRQRIHELAALVPATANVGHYARIVREMSQLREVIRFSQESARLAWDRVGDTEEIVERVQELAFELSRGGPGEDLELVVETTHAVYERLIRLHEEGRDVTGVDTGYDELNRMTSGFQPGNMITLAGRPSMGKTALAAGIVAHVVIHNDLPTAWFTLEMSKQEVIQRLIAHEGFVDLHKLRSGRLGQDDWSKVMRATAKVERAPLYLDDSGAPTMAEIRARARRLKLRVPNLAFVVIDYLQLVGEMGDRDNRTVEVSKMSRGVKVLARELNVPVLVLSQLSRAPEQRHDKRPMLADLRESGSVEQDSDVVLMTYRDEYYNPEDPDVAGIAEINIAKQRNGPTGMFKLSFVKRYARFSNPAPPGVNDGTVPAAAAAEVQPEPAQTSLADAAT